MHRRSVTADPLYVARRHQPGGRASVGGKVCAQITPDHVQPLAAMTRDKLNAKDALAQCGAFGDLDRKLGFFA